MNVGQVIRQKREAQSLSSKKLAEILNIDRSLLCRYENNKRKISKKHASIIANYLNGEYDREILNTLLADLEQKYKHLTGKKGLLT